MRRAVRGCEDFNSTRFRNEFDIPNSLWERGVTVAPVDVDVDAIVDDDACVLVGTVDAGCGMYDNVDEEAGAASRSCAGTRTLSVMCRFAGRLQAD
jgi:hypothetical protein